MSDVNEWTEYDTIEKYKFDSHRNCYLKMLQYRKALYSH